MASAILMGSARSDGNTRKVVGHIRGLIEADFYDLNDYKVGYFDYAFGQNDDFPSLMGQLVEYDHLILATPVYWYNMSAQMKTFFDRLTDLLNVYPELHARWRGKNLLLLSCGPDEDVPDYYARPAAASAEYLQLGFGGWVHTWLESGQLNSERQQAVRNWLKKAGLLT